MNTKPFLPSDYGRARSGQSLVRAAYAVAKTKGRFDDPATVAKSLWPSDRAALALLTKSDAVPADITSGVWGAGLAGTAVGEFISSLGPMSAGPS